MIAPSSSAESPSPQGRSAVRISSLIFTYFGDVRPALGPVSLEVREGEAVALVGPTGSGKSTLLRCINGLIPHFYSGTLEGSVEVFGLEPRRVGARRLSSLVASVLQNPEAQIIGQSVASDVALGPRWLGLEPSEVLRRTSWALEATGLSSLAQAPVFELSQGQRKRLALASALAVKPRLLLLDEPLAMLDPQGVEEVVGVLQQLKGGGLTLIIAEHRLEPLIGLVDRLIVLVEGKVALDQPLQEAVMNPLLDKLGLERPLLAEVAYSLGLRPEDISAKGLASLGRRDSLASP